MQLERFLTSADFSPRNLVRICEIHVPSLTVCQQAHLPSSSDEISEMVDLESLHQKARSRTSTNVAMAKASASVGTSWTSKPHNTMRAESDQTTMEGLEVNEDQLLQSDYHFKRV